MRTGRYLVVLLGLLAFIMPQSSEAQVKSHNNDIWFHYFGKNMLSKKTSFSFETTMRYANGLSEKQQWFIRPSFDYQLTKTFIGSVGYSHYNTYVYGDPAMNKTEIPEDHVWVQGTYVANSGNFKFTHRLRDENRFVGVAVKNNEGDYEVDHYDYRNRLRYMFLATYPLVASNGVTKLSAIAGDEVFVNIGANAGKTFLNQNRLIAGLGYNFNKHHQVQLCFIHQYIWNYPNTIQESNPTLRLSYVTNFDL
ncbi:hypothetical protein FLJC2902T_07710 [Flavobacterium limnosediminis JC2902]|uniref:DUF2490 domain-containing protein n=1 Tax=Flavobacterium limnosediminis JC2902 TaxID=1341181 RepID=V6SSE5_9FLAO|nr:DUF2490 domain-containing protein [Flavobacterium limnosediminis]ESU29374.1 hypothetical protein FLJC2902T_07710 [Flavobacterium limnosediminis JC2902]